MGRQILCRLYIEVSTKGSPGTFHSKQVKSHENWRIEWLTAQNINDWIENDKKYLIEHKFVKTSLGISVSSVLFGVLV